MGQNPAGKYTPEFRRETADYVIASGRPITECCRELGLNSKTVNDWVLKRRRELGGEVPAGDSDAELRRLKKRVRELEMENEFLKKPRPSLPGPRGSGALPADGGGEGELPDRDDGEVARREPVGLLRLGPPAPRRPVGGRARGRPRLLGGLVRPLRRAVGTAVLAARGVRLTLYRVRRLMRELGIRGVVRNAGKATTVPDPDAPSRPDLVRRRFDPPVPTTVLVGDITYLRTGQGWLYLAVVIDLATRMVVGWSMSERMTAGLAVAALEAAWARGYVAGGAIFHSDRGAQYTSRLMVEWAEGHDVRLSVGRTGSCHDSAVAESFFATLKNEMYSLRPWATRAEARHAVVGFIEAYYNRPRPHSTIGYQVPAERMAAFMERAERAFSEDEGAMPMAA